MSQIFNYKETIQLYHVDGVRRLFYGQLFFLNHNALAAFLKHIGYSLSECLDQKGFQFPIVHVEGNYYKPLCLDDEVLISISVVKIGTTSFALEYTLSRNGEVVADAKTVHVVIDDKTEEKISIPDEFKKILSVYSKQEELV